MHSAECHVGVGNDDMPWWNARVRNPRRLRFIPFGRPMLGRRNRRARLREIQVQTPQEILQGEMSVSRRHQADEKAQTLKT